MTKKTKKEKLTNYSKRLNKSESKRKHSDQGKDTIPEKKELVKIEVQEWENMTMDEISMQQIGTISQLIKFIRNKICLED